MSEIGSVTRRYEDYQQDLFQLLGHIITMEKEHKVKKLAIVKEIKDEIEENARLLEKRDNEKEAKEIK